MAQCRTFLFGRFHAESDGLPLSGLDGAKAQELYSFLLLHRDRPHLGVGAPRTAGRTADRSDRWLRATLGAPYLT